MKIYEDVLPPKLLKKCIEELRSTTGSPVWGISNLFWTEDLKVGLVGNVSMRILPEETALEVNKSLKKSILIEVTKLSNNDRYNIITVI